MINYMPLFIMISGCDSVKDELTHYIKGLIYNNWMTDIYRSHAKTMHLLTCKFCIPIRLRHPLFIHWI